MNTLPILMPGDSVEIIAPASRCTDERLIGLKELLASWKLNCFIQHDIFGHDLLCANSDEARFKFLKNALLNRETKAVICARGGYGSMRLIPEVSKITPPPFPKLFVGMSDLTALHLFLTQEWQWATIHGALAKDEFSPESTSALKAILFGESDSIELPGLPLNKFAEQSHTIETSLTGGNLCLVQTSIGTLWQMNGRHKIIFLEEVSERGYRIDRMLEHLRQANIFKDAAAIVFGDFLEGAEPDGSSLIQPVLERFAQSCQIPVIQIEGVGHGFKNFPLIFGTKTKLRLGKRISLVTARSGRVYNSTILAQKP